MVKRCIWELSVPEKTPCTLTDRVPKIIKSGDMNEDNDRNARREAHLYVMQELWMQPQHCLFIQSILHSRIGASAHVSDSLHFKDAPSCLFEN